MKEGRQYMLVTIASRKCYALTEQEQKYFQQKSDQSLTNWSLGFLSSNERIGI